MRRATLLGFLLAAGGLAAGGPAAIESRGPDRSRALELELAAAKKPAGYAVLNLETKTLELRLRGRTLKKWPILSVGLRGRTIETESVKLLRKSAWTKPRRTNITPGEKDKDEKNKKDSEPEVLEAGDMPARFRMVLEKGISITINPRKGNLLRRLGDFGGSILRSAYMPLKTLWCAVAGKDYTEIRVSVGTEAEAKAVYWALQDGIQAIIIRP